jgi:hypothetical protein
MKPIPPTPRTLDVARRIIWFEPPEQALADPIRFMAYAMTYARHEDMQVIRQYACDDDFRAALDQAPPGIIDARSWAYWNSKIGRYPAPPLPVRRFDRIADNDGRSSEHWLQQRKGEAVNPDPEGVSRSAREDWRNKYRK